MTSYYTSSNASLGKLAHHSAMADVHASLSSHYYEQREKLTSDMPDPSTASNSRKVQFYDAALKHHRSEISYNENQSREYKAGRSYSATTQSGPAQPDDDLMKQPSPKTISTDDSGNITSYIPQQHVSNRQAWAEQGNKSEVRDSGGTTPVDPQLKNKRFM